MACRRGGKALARGAWQGDGVFDPEEVTITSSVGGSSRDAGPIERYLEAIEGAAMAGCNALREDATLDATVPNWRYTVRGDVAVRSELGRWYADAGSFEELKRTPLPMGELVEFTLRWEEGGVPHACHQVHIVEVADGRITRDQAWCGGRWPAALLAEMAEAADAQG